MLYEGLTIFGASWFLLPIALRAVYFVPVKCKSKKRLDGKVALVTGANTGLGKANAADLVSRGAKVYIACRSIEKAEKAKQDIIESCPNAQITVLKLDLCSLASVTACAEEFLKREDNLHILVANAGFGNFYQHRKTEEGIERHLGANHLGHFLLTRKLLPALEKAGTDSEKSRVVVVSSRAHIAAKSIDYEGLQAGNLVVAAYSHSKLANILFAKQFDKLKGEFGRYLLPGIWAKLAVLPLFPMYWIAKTPLEGAQTQIFASVDESMEGVSGKYLGNCKVLAPSAAAQNDDEAEKLWKWSCEKTGLTYEL